MPIAGEMHNQNIKDTLLKYFLGLHPNAEIELIEEL